MQLLVRLVHHRSTSAPVTPNLSWVNTNLVMPVLLDGGDGGDGDGEGDSDGASL